MGFVEVADRVWVARQEWYDVNLSLVAGSSGLLLVDTHASARAAGEVLDDVRRLGLGAVTAVVNTHAHHDHTLGNAEVRARHGSVPVWAHEQAAARTGPVAVQAVEDLRAAGDARAEEVAGTAVVAADHTFSSAVALDLGDRQVELVHPGRGHTDGDLVVRVPDAEVVIAGDLVEEAEASARGSVPDLGVDCWPLEWPLALDVVLSLTRSGSVVVPGHGAVVDRGFVEEQRGTLGVVGETIRDLATRGVPAAEALGAAEWPYPREALVHAVARGYAHLPRSQRRLPLL